MASPQNVTDFVHCVVWEVNMIRLNRASHGVVSIRSCTAYIDKHDLRQPEEIMEAEDEGNKLGALVPAPNNLQVIEHQIHGVALGAEASQGIAEGGDKVRGLVGNALPRGGGGRRRRAELGEEGGEERTRGREGAQRGIGDAMRTGADVTEREEERARLPRGGAPVEEQRERRRGRK